MEDLESLVKQFTWLGQSGFRIPLAGKTIYIDVAQGRPEQPADLVLVTHEHGDHCSPELVQRIQRPDTVIVTIAACAGRFRGDVRTVRPGDTLEVAGIRISAVPAYNVNKFRAPGRPFHPKEDGKVGFVLEAGGVRIYHAGDTDVIPEMREIKADIALLPVSGTYVMTAEEAAEAVRILQPKLAVPMHYGSLVGSRADAERFQQLAAPTPVVILPQSER
jgi:L-ascorbate metabolism protein UlaG (beta-lactamase superfamily)